MKYRSSFVSNSSSSSFVVTGHISQNPLKDIKEGKTVMLHVIHAGTSGEVEDWSYILDEESYNIITKSKWYEYRKHISTFFVVSDKTHMQYHEDICEGVFHVDEDVMNETLFAFNRDYSSPDNIDQLKRFLEKYDHSC